MLEPKAAGRYAGKKVQLHPDKRTLVENFTRQYNTIKKFREYPIINCPEYVIRKIGCLSGDRVIYINSNGLIQQCPFYDQTCEHSLTLTVDEAIRKVRQLPCPDYEHANI
jgi:MoaA/NifB/PqqE/SkfB family radical SAM enzyme